MINVLQYSCLLTGNIITTIVYRDTCLNRGVHQSESDPASPDHLHLGNTNSRVTRL